MTHIDARTYLDEAIRDAKQLPEDLAWSTDEVLETLQELRGLLGAPGTEAEASLGCRDCSEPVDDCRCERTCALCGRTDIVAKDMPFDDNGTAWVAGDGSVICTRCDPIKGRSRELPIRPARRQDLTPCGNIVCTGCRVCGCPSLGIEPQVEPSDRASDAAQIAFHEHTFGPDPDFLTPRRLEAGRAAWKVALRAAAAISEQERAANQE